MHDWTRLCTISSFASAFAWHKADRKASTFAVAAGASTFAPAAGATEDGTEDRWAWQHGFIATKPFFAVVCRFVTKNIFFYLY
jgi:hypothetical protein